MRRVWALLVMCLVATSLFSASTTHARANLTCVSASASAETGHLSNSDDRAPADGKGGMPHHHAGCHGHQFAPQVAEAIAVSANDRDAQLVPTNAFFLPATTADPALRPPRA